MVCWDHDRIIVFIEVKVMKGWGQMNLVWWNRVLLGGMIIIIIKLWLRIILLWMVRRCICHQRMWLSWKSLSYNISVENKKYILKYNSINVNFRKWNFNKNDNNNKRYKNSVNNVYVLFNKDNNSDQ